MSAAEYQKQLEAAGNYAVYRRSGGAEAPLTSGMAAAHIQVPSLGPHLLNKAGEYLPFVARDEAAGQGAYAAAAAGASQQLAAAQQPAAAQAIEESGRAISKSSTRSLQKSAGSKVRAMLLIELQMDGVPPAAATVIARRGIPLATLKNFSVEWAVARLTEKEVTLSESEWQHSWRSS